MSLTGFMKKEDAYHPSKGSQLVGNIQTETIKIINKKYSLNCCGSGVAMPGGPILEITLCFQTKCAHTQDQLRELLIKSAQELVNQVNNNEEIQQFLTEPPFSLKNVQIIIFNHDASGRELYDPYLCGGEISNEELKYRSVDINDTFKYNHEYKESYEEALNLLGH